MWKSLNHSKPCDILNMSRASQGLCVLRLEDGSEVDSITVMVQKEVAERMCATNKDSNYGIL